MYDFPGGVASLSDHTKRLWISNLILFFEQIYAHSDSNHRSITLATARPILKVFLNTTLTVIGSINEKTMNRSHMHFMFIAVNLSNHVLSPTDVL